VLGSSSMNDFSSAEESEESPGDTTKDGHSIAEEGLDDAPGVAQENLNQVEETVPCQDREDMIEHAGQTQRLVQEQEQGEAMEAEVNDAHESHWKAAATPRPARAEDQDQEEDQGDGFNASPDVIWRSGRVEATSLQLENDEDCGNPEDEDGGNVEELSPGDEVQTSEFVGMLLDQVTKAMQYREQTQQPSSRSRQREDSQDAGAHRRIRRRHSSENFRTSKHC